MSLLNNDFSELEIGNSAESLKELLGSQKELFHSQVDQLQKIVVAQCRLTGVNPLSQEMAAGALSIKIGKRPRDLLNPKAVKYMQSVFSIKDAISKKESREISALFGVTVTQVRDFFASQRSRVRKLVRISRDRGTKSNGCNEPGDRVLKRTDPVIPLNPVPLSSVVPASVEEAQSSLIPNEMLSGIDDLDKHFVDSIFDQMRTEETFTGQVKLMEWILEIQNPTVLLWFSTKGGLSILASWLSEAAFEEQTSVLHVILKVLYHLPLQKVLPVHLSAILQGVNRLRFYKTSDISNRAKALLARWSKAFARNQALKKPNEMKSFSSSQKEALPSQSVGEIMGVDSWKSNFDGEILASLNNAKNARKLESSPMLKLLPASTDDLSRKNTSGISSSQTRERRKVQLVEQPGHKTTGRSPQATRAVPLNQGRPMSADDIQKAKMRAQFMQSKYRKAGSSMTRSKEVKTEARNKASITQHSALCPVSEVSIGQKIEELKKPPMVPPKTTSKPQMLDTEVKTDVKKPLVGMCKKVLWQKPSEVRLDESWRVSAGEDSKEVEVQKNRNRREKEAVYQKVEEIPPNPKDPWDLEMDFDDSLTPEIPLEQLPDDDNADTQLGPNGNESGNERKSNILSSLNATAQVNGGTSAGAEPDLELLAVLLKNPELVFALTSGQAGNLSSEETMKLLDTVKTGGGNLVANVNGMGGKVEKVEVSLPSPTPSNDPGTSGCRQEVGRNPFSRQGSVDYLPASFVTTILPPEKNSVASLWQPHIQAAEQIMPQQHINTLSHQSQLSTPSYSRPQVHSAVPFVQQTLPAHSMVNQTLASEVAKNNLSIPTMPLPNLQTASMLSIQGEGPSSVHAPVAQERQSILYQNSPLSSRLGSQTQSSVTPPLYESRQLTAAHRPPVDQVSDSWRAQPELASDHYLQPNQVDYNIPYGGPARHPMGSGPSRERTEIMDEDEFESWSPDNSPNRPSEYMVGRHVPESRMNYDRNYRPERSRPRNFSGFRDHNRQGNRRWHDRRY